MAQANIIQELRTAVSILQEGGLVAIPTETVYGLAANALNERAVARIFEAKGRPSFNPIIVHLAQASDLEIYADLDADRDEGAKHPSRHAAATRRALEKLSSFWPGPLTVLLPRGALIPPLVTAGGELCGFRIPDHPLALELIRECGFPLAAPSANTSNRRSPTSAQMVLQDRFLVERIDAILDGGGSVWGIESTVLEILDESRVLVHRPGGVTTEALNEAGFQVFDANDPKEPKSGNSAPVSPGRLLRHYAPAHPLFLYDEDSKRGASAKEDWLQALHKEKNINRVALLGFQGRFAPIPKRLQVIKQLDLSESGSLREAASRLFLYFDRLDQIECDAILALRLPETGLARAINDRLQRASQHGS